MSSDVAKVIVGLAGAVGLALVAFARENGASIPGETVPAPPPGTTHPPFGPGLDPVSAAAEVERARWVGRDETDPSVRDRLKSYWEAAGENPDAFPAGWESDKPWSAAFISFVAQQGAPGSLKPSASHWGYTRAALGNTEPGSFRAYPPGGFKALPGDIIVRTRLKDDRRTLKDVESIAFHPSHGDVVVASGPGGIDYVGGNLAHSVQQRTYLRDGWGDIADPRVFAVLRRNPEARNV